MSKLAVVREAVRKLASRHRSVIGIYLFGNRDIASLKSPFHDIDLAVVLWPYDKYVAADVALSLPPKFDVTILNEAPPFIVVEVLKKGELLYHRNTRKLSEAMMSITGEIRRHRAFLERMGAI